MFYFQSYKGGWNNFQSTADQNSSNGDKPMATGDFVHRMSHTSTLQQLPNHKCRRHLEVRNLTI